MSDEIIRRTVICTLQQLGMVSGYVSFNKARELFGKPFHDACKDGRIRPVSKGEGRNGKFSYKMSDIIHVLYEN